MFTKLGSAVLLLNIIKSSMALNVKQKQKKISSKYFENWASSSSSMVAILGSLSVQILSSEGASTLEIGR